MLRIHGIGGYEEVGRNMTCIEVDDEALILDMGLYMDRFVALQEKKIRMNKEILLNEDAIPNDNVIKSIKKKIKAIVISHAHLDHVGAVKWMASSYECPVVTTPYTAEYIKRTTKIKNKIVRVNVNSSYRISKKLEIEFINVTHSIPQSTMIKISTPYGNILYGLDYKNDNHPMLGRKTNIGRLRKLDDVILLIADSTNADVEGKTFSESIAKEMLKDILFSLEMGENGLFLTTFSSHIARQKTMLKLIKDLGREAVFIGRSLYEYIESAEKLKLVDFSSHAKLIKNARDAEKLLNEMNKKKNEYAFIVTGGMGEKDAILSQIANDELALKISSQDIVIFSSAVIPTPTIQANRKILEQKLHRKKARIFKDVHVSGHGSREDLRDLIKIVNPQHILAAHGDMNKCASLATLANEMGYVLGKDVHLMQNGQTLKI